MTNIILIKLIKSFKFPLTVSSSESSAIHSKVES